MYDIYERDIDIDLVEVALMRERRQQAEQAMGWQLPRPDEATVAGWFAHLPQNECPVQTADDIAAGLADILADLRAGTILPLVEGTEDDELEPVGYAERYG